MGNGMTTAGTISGYLDRADILKGILTAGFELSNVVSLIDQVEVPNLDGSIPIFHPGGADEDPTASTQGQATPGQQFLGGEAATTRSPTTTEQQPIVPWKGKGQGQGSS